MRTVALAVGFVHHVDQRLFPGGFIGVDIFFIISGYVISSLLLREREMTGGIRSPGSTCGESSDYIPRYS